MERADRYCRACGLEVRADAAAIDKYLSEILPGRVNAALEKRVSEQKIVEVETAEAVADRAMKWLRTLGFFLGIPAAAFLALLTFVGLKSYSDIESAANHAADLEKRLTGPEQQLDKAIKDLGELQKALEGAKITLSQVGDRQSNLEGQLNAIKGRLDFSPSSNLTPELKGKLQDGLAHFIVYLTGIGFRDLDDRVVVTVYSAEQPLHGQFANQTENINAFYNSGVLYIHRAMADDLSVALIEYMHHVLEAQRLPDSDLYYGLSDYFAASFLNSPVIGAGLGHLLKLSTPFIRNLDNNVGYTEVTTEPHDRGRVWGGALWRCRQATDQAGADHAAFEALRAVTEGAPSRNIDKVFGTKLTSQSDQVGECLAKEISRRALPRGP